MITHLERYRKTLTVDYVTHFKKITLDSSELQSKFQKIKKITELGVYTCDIFKNP